MQNKNRGGGGQGGCDRKSKVIVKIQKKKIGGRGVCQEDPVGGQGGCEQRIDVCVKMQNKNQGGGSG